MARPTKYSDEIVSKAQQYLDNYDEDGSVIPTIEGMSLYLEVSRETLYDWSRQEDKKAFSDILDRCSAKQATMVLNKGLSGDYNSTMAKLLLTKHGYSDKQENTHSGGDTPIEIDHMWQVNIVG